MADERPVTREEYEALLARVRMLEGVLARAGAPPPVSVERPAPVVAPTAVPSPGLRPAPLPAPAYTPIPRAAPPRSAPSRPAVSLETMIGKQFAPRIGATLVFLATLFFLGLAIQRGWIGPVAQLAIAAAGALALLGVAAWLSRSKGYGTYPQVLEGTAMCMLYVVAFVAHAVAYYERETGLSDVGSGVLMALVAGATVGLALWRDARVIAGLGFVLAFLTAGAGFGVLPGLTLAYVAILATALAAIVAWKRWDLEALVGSFVTALFFTGLIVRSNAPIHSGPDAWMVALAALPPIAAFLALPFRARADAGKRDLPLGAALAFLTLGWAAWVTSGAASDPPIKGEIVLAWAAVGAVLAWLAASRALRTVAVACGIAAVGLYVVGVPLALRDAPARDLLTTLAYAAGALALGLAQLARRSTGAWVAALALATAAAGRAVFVDDRLQFAPGAAADPFGTWEAWLTFAGIAAALVATLALAPQTAPKDARRAAFLGGAAFLTVWAWALFHSAFLTTTYLLVVGAAFVVVAAAWPAVAAEAAAAALVLLAVAAVKTATYDTHFARPPMPIALGLIETVLVAGLLLTLHHVAALRRRLVGTLDAQALGAALVGGSAAVIVSFVFAYAQGPWVSVLLGGWGVAYLATGLIVRRESTYRYVGFGVLGFVLVRVFLVDLGQADLAIRALVFLVLGAILLGVGFAYARIQRNAAPPPPTPPVPSAPRTPLSDDAPEFEIVDPKG